MTDDKALPFPLYCFSYDTRDCCFISHLIMPDGKRIAETAKSGNRTMWTDVSMRTPWVFTEEKVGAGSGTV
jgi:hypothetical protein